VVLTPPAETSIDAAVMSSEVKATVEPTAAPRPTVPLVPLIRVRAFAPSTAPRLIAAPAGDALVVSIVEALCTVSAPKLAACPLVRTIPPIVVAPAVRVIPPANRLVPLRVTKPVFANTVAAVKEASTSRKPKAPAPAIRAGVVNPAEKST